MLIYFFTSALLFIFISSSASAATGLTLQGRIVRDSKGITASSVSFLVQIRSPGSENCLLYQETHTVNMSQSSGLFSLPIGLGTRAAASIDGGYSLQRIFTNRGSINLSSVVVNSSNTQPCASGNSYAPAATDKRKIVYSFNDGQGSVALAPIEVSYNPLSLYALDSEALGGFASSNVLRVENAGVPGAANALTTAQMTELMNLITGASVQFVKPNSAAFTAQPTFAGVPVNPGDLVNKAYVDAAASAGLPNTGTAGAYYKVTTDAQGRVVAGVATLVAGDVPVLDAAKITTGTFSDSMLATITTAGKVSGNAITTGTISGNTIFNSSGAVIAGSFSTTGTLAAGNTTITGNVTATGTVTANTVSGNSIRAYNGPLNYIELAAPVATSGAVNFKLPAADGTAGQILKTDGSGNWGWVSPNSGSVTSVSGTAPMASSGGTTPAISLNTGNGLTVSANNLVVDAGLGAGKIPQVAGSALGASGVVIANGTGTALASLNCASGEVIKFDASGFAICGTDSTGGVATSVLASNGTQAAPSISFSGETDTGWYLSAADSLSASTAGAERIRIDPTGNITIGTTSATSYRMEIDRDESVSLDGTVMRAFSSYRVPGASNTVAISGRALYRGLGATTGTIKAGNFSAENSNASGGDITNLVGSTSVANTYKASSTVTNLIGAENIAMSGYTGGTTVTTATASFNSVQKGSIGTGSVTDARAGFFETNPAGTLAVTNAYGVYVGTVSGTNKFSIYANDSTAPSYFAGNVGIGKNNPGSALDVKGAIRMSGSTSGYVGFRPAAAAGSTVWELPSADGTNGQVLKTDGAGILSWTTVSGTGLQPANNLSDLANAATARTNLGLGTAATLNVGTAVNDIVQLMTSGGPPTLPAVDGSQLTGLVAAQIPNLDAAKIATGTIAAARMPALTGDVTMTAGTTATAISGLARSKLASGTANHVIINDGSGVMASEANLAVTRGGTGSGSFGNNSVIISNGTGSALTSLNCTVGQVIKFDASGFAVCGTDSGTGDIINGGNTTGAAVTIGTNDAQNLQFETGNATAMTILPSGNVGIGITNPTNLFEVVGGSSAASGKGISISGQSSSGFMTSGGSINLISGNSDTSQAGAINLTTGYGNLNNGPINLSSGLLNINVMASVPTYWPHTRFYNTLSGTGANQGTGIALATKRTGAVQTDAAEIGAVLTDISAAYKGALFFKTADGAGPAERMRIDHLGNVGIGTSAPRAKLDVSGGSIAGNPAIVNGTATVNFSSGNLQYTVADCGAFNLHNMKDGASYTFAVQGANSATCSFNAYSDAGTTGLTMHLPPDHAATTAAKHTIYTFIVLGSHVYASWIPGY